ncbi:DNA repair protein RAD50 [Portunus trituberculatus]|uniref:DNA repair protein RAD50 n=1 Tax=Portunus trituberculatus TaxID=210409 RepID=A0A5B7IHL7_PORTR|nr:DNA repair protein RAD50 [Portunus trituberculatus]
MSHVSRLAILGVRSFGTDEHKVVEFNRPLTLILGQNGCGKTLRAEVGMSSYSALLYLYTTVTNEVDLLKCVVLQTIIESLKYVTTGDPPPGSGSGSSFIHDPKITGEAKVRIDTSPVSCLSLKSKTQGELKINELQRCLMFFSHLLICVFFLLFIYSLC